MSSRLKRVRTVRVHQPLVQVEYVSDLLLRNNTLGEQTPQIMAAQIVLESQNTSVSRQYISIDRRLQEFEADQETSQKAINRNGKRPQLGYDRLANARRRQSIPDYEVKQSKKTTGRQKRLAWLERQGKAKFEAHFASILVPWGVKDMHKGTCVLLPEDWKSLDPILLSNLFTPERCPLAGSGRFSYRYPDHVKGFARAVARYQTWPRRADDVGQFLGSAAYKDKDTSHTCHQEFCLIHITYEGADINHDRKLCCERDKFLRAEGRPIPENCTRHNPPCSIQVCKPSSIIF